MPGPKPRPAATRASQVLPPIRVLPGQRDAYRAAAVRAGVSLSAWAKRLLDAGAGYSPAVQTGDPGKSTGTP